MVAGLVCVFILLLDAGVSSPVAGNHFRFGSRSSVDAERLPTEADAAKEGKSFRLRELLFQFRELRGYAYAQHSGTSR
jgi:hypothetical protein